MFGFELGQDSMIKAWMKGCSTEMPRTPKYDTDIDTWDVGLIVAYWSQ